jgi:hypothetical protein
LPCGWPERFRIPTLLFAASPGRPPRTRVKPVRDPSSVLDGSESNRTRHFR